MSAGRCDVVQRATIQQQCVCEGKQRQEKMGARGDACVCGSGSSTMLLDALRRAYRINTTSAGRCDITQQALLCLEPKKTKMADMWGTQAKR